jgi:hypothetical protein
MTPIEFFLKEIDELWVSSGADKITLRVIGSTALMMQTGYNRGTKDRDVLEADALAGDVGKRLLELAGQGSRLHQKYRVYLDIVPRGLPFLPRRPEFHPAVALNQLLGHFQVEMLGVVDTVVSKLKRFNANDINDIEAMVAMDLVQHADLINRFRSAVDLFAGDARAEDLPKYVRNLHRVERDFLLVPETRIELPSWVDDSD